MLRAGDLKHKITIQEVAEAQSGTGAVAETWSTHATVFADIRPISGREFIESEIRNADVTHRVYIRNLSTVRAKMRFVWNSRTFEIIAPPMNARENNDLMTMMCREINP